MDTPVSIPVNVFILPPCVAIALLQAHPSSKRS